MPTAIQKLNPSKALLDLFAEAAPEGYFLTELIRKKDKTVVVYSTIKKSKREKVTK